jgi:hypothetical protein
VTAAQRFLALNSFPNASELQNSLLNSLIAGKSNGDGCDQHCVASQAVLKQEIEPLKREKSPLLAGFCNFAPVSELPNWRTRRPFREKSPATTANIPVFGRLSLETRFDLHCVRGAGVDSSTSQENFCTASRHTQKILSKPCTIFTSVPSSLL